MNEDTASPTVSLEAILLTCVIDAFEIREIVVVDIPNAFIQTQQEVKIIFIKVKGKLATILCNCAPHIYKPFITQERGQPTLYVKTLKAIYGLLESMLLFYKKLRKDITEIGFKVNPYDPYVANMQINEGQITLT